MLGLRSVYLCYLRSLNKEDRDVRYLTMISIADSIDKTTIPAMPQVTFPGTITVVDTVDAAASAISYLKTRRVVGFDTETRPSFRRGVYNKIALLQLASADRAYLFRLNVIGLPDFVCDFLANSKVRKIGLSVKDDFNSLRGRSAIEPQNFVELQELAGSMGIREKGLQRMYALLFGQRISKGQQLSNWEADELSDGQCMYAAIDAWACIRIYRFLNRLRKSGDYRIVVRNGEESNTEER